jgi:hypothetical protein
MQKQTYKIANDLGLVKIDLSKKQEAKPVNVPTNHILVVDCSGSMSGELAGIRSQLKNKLPTLVRQGDTVSLIWFSGRGQYGMLADKVKVEDAIDLQRLNAAIDRWLKPVGMTAFVEPLREVLKLATSSSGVYSLFFLTDGYDNAWSENEIVNATANLRDVLSGAVFVEYGWNCNRRLMTKMAESVGGNLVFCENFDAYEPVLSSALSKGFCSAKKIEVQVDNPLFDLVFSVSDGGPCVYKVEAGKVLVPEGTDAVYCFADKFTPTNTLTIFPKASNIWSEELMPVYQGVALLAQRMKSKTVAVILGALGDVKLFKKFSNCFGKQNLSDFQTMVLEASKSNKMFEEGYDSTLKVDPNAFTVLDLLFLLAEDDKNLFVPSKMNYNRISRATEDSMEDFTDEEQEEIANMQSKAKNATAYKKVQARIDEIIASKPKKLTFKYASDDQGYPVSNLTWNEDRPNVSIQVRIDGTVDLTSCPFSNIPTSFKTFIYRNYAIIRDGIANIDELPVILSHVTFIALKKEGIVSGDWKEGEVYMINLRKLPTINQAMVVDISAKNLFSLEYTLAKLKASQKVYNAFKEQWCGKRTSEGFKTKYGEEAAAWLSEQGLTDYSGFSPKRKQAESTDVYKGVSITIALKGISSLPSFNDLKKKIDSGKPLTAREALLKPAYDECLKAFGKYSGDDLKTWVETTSKETTKKTREIIRKMAEIKFGIVVGQAWPIEFKDISENTLTVNLDGVPFECSVKLEEVDIKV